MRFEKVYSGQGSNCDPVTLNGTNQSDISFRNLGSLIKMIREGQLCSRLCSDTSQREKTMKTLRGIHLGALKPRCASGSMRLTPSTRCSHHLLFCCRLESMTLAVSPMEGRGGAWSFFMEGSGVLDNWYSWWTTFSLQHSSWCCSPHLLVCCVWDQ